MRISRTSHVITYFCVVDVCCKFTQTLDAFPSTCYHPSAHPKRSADCGEGGRWNRSSILLLGTKIGACPKPPQRPRPGPSDALAPVLIWVGASLDVGLTCLGSVWRTWISGSYEWSTLLPMD